MSRLEEAATIAEVADFSIIRYAQCWEDADVVLEGLDVQPGDVCLSICSGGDNTLSLLSRSPARVIAVDLAAAQTACLELKVAAYRELRYPEFLEIVGARPSTRRGHLYARIRGALSESARTILDARADDIERGFIACGKFERYLRLFRQWLLPLIHPSPRVDDLFTPRSAPDRRRFYRDEWNNRRWRLLTRVFVSRLVMGRLGRDPAFFRYVEGRVADRILARTERALTELEPAENPYLQWIALGRFATVLPHWLRPENFETIRGNLHRLEIRVAPIETVLGEAGDRTMDRFNMSDVFEYISPELSNRVFEDIARTGRAGGRVLYWNMLAPRRSPPYLAHRMRPMGDLSERLHQVAKTFFYGALVVEEIW